MTRNPYFADLTIREFGARRTHRHHRPRAREPLNEEQPPTTLNLYDADERQPLGELEPVTRWRTSARRAAEAEGSETYFDDDLHPRPFRR